MHTFVNDLERSVGAYLYGRRMYETMAGWETDPSFVVYSRTMGAAELAAGAFAAGLIDECHVFLAPVLVGAGNRCWPDRVSVRLVPLEDRRFDNGMVFIRYRTKD